MGETVRAALNVAATDGARSALMIGPDEWPLLGPDGEAAQAMRAIGAVVEEPHALVDVSHRNVAFTLSGALAADVLATGCMLDLDPAAFPAGMATRTLFAKAEIVLWRTGAEAFHVEVWRSFAGYLHGLLVEASREYVRA